MKFGLKLTKIEPSKSTSNTSTSMAPRLRGKSRRSDSTTLVQDDDDKLEDLLEEMEAHMALDRILEARKVVDQIQAQYGGTSAVGISDKRRREIEHIMEESDHIRGMLHDLQTDDDWTLANKRKGVTVHYRHEEGSSIHTIKTETILEGYSATEFLNLLSLFAEADLMPKWFPDNVLESTTILCEPNQYHKIVLSVLSMPWPVATREMLAEAIGYHLSDMNAFMIFSKTIDESEYCQVPPLKKGRVRMESRVVFFFQLLSENRVRFCQISHDNLKLRFIPAFLLNYIAQGALPAAFIHAFKKQVQNFEGTEWEQRVQVERRSFYKGIEDRIHEELQTMHGGRKENGHERAAATVNGVKARQPTKPKKEFSFETESRLPGMPISQSVLIACTLVTATRLSLSSERMRLPLAIYVLILSIAAALLTHCTVQYQKASAQASK